MKTDVVYEEIGVWKSSLPENHSWSAFVGFTYLHRFINALMLTIYNEQVLKTCLPRFFIRNYSHKEWKSVVEIDAWPYENARKGAYVCGGAWGAEQQCHAPLRATPPPWTHHHHSPPPLPSVSTHPTLLVSLTSYLFGVWRVMYIYVSHCVCLCACVFTTAKVYCMCIVQFI